MPYLSGPVGVATTVVTSTTVVRTSSVEMSTTVDGAACSVVGKATSSVEISTSVQMSVTVTVETLETKMVTVENIVLKTVVGTQTVVAGQLLLVSEVGLILPELELVVMDMLPAEPSGVEVCKGPMPVVFPNGTDKPAVLAAQLMFPDHVGAQVVQVVLNDKVGAGGAEELVTFAAQAGFSWAIKAIEASSMIGVPRNMICRQFAAVAVVFHTIPRHGVSTPASSALHTATQSSGVS